MKNFVFTIIASGLDPEADDFENRFYEAGCNDATIAYQKGRIILEFARDAEDFAHALESAVEAVQKAGAKVERIEPDSGLMAHLPQEPTWRNPNMSREARLE